MSFRPLWTGDLISSIHWCCTLALVGDIILSLEISLRNGKGWLMTHLSLKDRSFRTPCDHNTVVWCLLSPAPASQQSDMIHDRKELYSVQLGCHQQSMHWPVLSRHTNGHSFTSKFQQVVFLMKLLCSCLVIFLSLSPHHKHYWYVWR